MRYLYRNRDKKFFRNCRSNTLLLIHKTKLAEKMVWNQKKIKKISEDNNHFWKIKSLVS